MILLTGFKPFDKYTINSSWEAVKVVGNAREDIMIHEIEVDFHKAHFEIISLLDKNRPNSVLMCGLNPENKFRLEMRAKKPYELEDVEGAEEYAGSWDWEKAIKKVSNSGVELKKSFDAGQYVCESIYWSALNHNHTYGIVDEIAFLHVPPISKKWNKQSIANVILDVLNHQESLPA